MEDLYTLPDGSTVDISKYSQLEKMTFLLNNEGAKKLKGGAKSAVVAPKSKKALPKSTDLKSVNGPSSSQKSNLLNPFEDYDGQEVGDVETWGKSKKQGTKLENLRLPTLEELQKKGEAPPPSESASESITDPNELYNMVGPGGNKINKPEFKLATTEGKKEQKTIGRFTVGEGAVDDLIESIDNPGNKDNQRRDLKYDIDTIKNKIQLTDSELINPYLYYSSKNKKIDDDFVDKNFNSKELEEYGVNPDDFDGFLNRKGYKDDFLKKETEGIYEGTGNATLARYDIGLAKELAKKKMLNMYMEDMQQRDFTRQDLNQDLEITFGVRDKKEIVHNDIFDPVGMSKYVEKNFPIVTQKLKDRDVENRKIYDESKKGGTDFFSWDTVGKMGKSGWNAVVDRTKQISASAYSAIGMEATAEGIRALDEENKFVRPDDRGVSYASGKTASYNGNDYLVDSRGEIYDKDAKIRITDLFDESEYKNIVETSKYGPSDWMFSLQGTAVQTSGVMADMLIQAAVTRGVGQFGKIASEARVALNGARQTSKFTSLLNDSSQLLRKLPLDRATGYSMIAQGALGYSQGYEDTLKAARDSGINDSEAFKLASTAAQRMAVLYSTTGVINPQTKLAENVFGSRNVIKKAIDQYLKVGEKGFVGYIDDIIKSTPRNLVEFAEEGGKEVVQENIQQIGEIGVNRLTNEQAGKKIMNDTMTGDDFMNTSILSFLSSGLISKIKMPSFKAGNQDTDNLSSLSTLAKNKKEFVKIVDNLATEKVFTQEQVDNLKSDVDIYSNNINKMPKDTSSKAAMPILRSLDKIQKLKDEKESLDKAFHPSIDEKIKKEEVIANGLYNTDRLEAKTKLIQNAIKKGVIKNIEMKSFSDDNSIVKYLTEELNMSEDEAKSYADSGGFFLDENLLKEYSRDPSSIVKGQKLIVVNEDYAIRTGNVEAAQHEFLHGLIHETIKNDPEAQQLLGRSLTKELMKMKDKVDIEGTGETPLPQVFKDRFSLYIKKYQKEIAKVNADLELGKISKEEHDAEVDSLIGDQWEEALTIYSDAISNGSVKYDEGTFSKLKDVIRQVLQNLGVKNIKFESGKDVYNFLKDYNQSVKTGNFGISGLGAMRKLGSQKAEINREKLREETGIRALNVEQTPSVTPKVKLSLGGDRRSVEKKSSDDIKKDVDNAYNKETFTQKTNSQRDPLLFDIVEEYEYLIRGKAKSEGFFNLPGFEKDKKEREKDFVQETKFELISHIRNFNKEFLELREEYKQNLISNGFDPNSKEFKEILDAKDAEGYKGKKGIVKENNSLNGWINSQILNKMKNALKKAGIVDEKFNLDVEGENFVEGRGTTDIGETPDYLLGDSVDVMEATEDFNEEQEKLANILKDPVFKFVDEKGEDVIIDTVPERGDYVISAKDQGIEANKQLKTETDPARIEELKSDLRDLQRGLDLQNKEEPLTPEEKQELKSLKPTKAFNLTTGNVEYVFKAIIKKESPAKIIARQVAEEILRSPNVETLEFRNFKKLLADKSMTMMKRITFETGEGLESLMYNNWKLVYDVINNPVDEVTGQSSYASKKIPPYLKERNEKGEFQKVANINRSVFLQSFYSEEDAKKIIRKYNSNNPEEEIVQFLDYEQLTTNAWFDRRTALRELFGDVMVLQEARRLLRNPDFIEQIGVEKPNLYNSLKDDVIRTQVLNNLAKGKSNRVKFSLSSDNKENKEFLKNFPNLLKSKEYNTFKNRIRDIYHSGSEIEENWKKHDIKAIWFSAGASQGWYGDGTLYKSDLASLPGSIVMPDWNRSGDVWNERFTEKFPEIQEVLLRDMYDSNQDPEYVRDENGNILYDDDLGDVTWDEYLEEEFPRIFNLTGKIDLDEFIEFGESRNQGDIFKKIARDYIKRNVDRKPLIKKLTFEEFKENELEFEPPTPGIFWLLKPENIKYADKVILEYIKGYEEDPDSYLSQTEGGMNNPDGTLGDYTELIVIGPMKGQKIEKQDEKGKYSRIKFTLTESDIESKLPNLLKSKEYKKFREAIKGNFLGHSGSEVIEKAYKTDKTPVLWWVVGGEPERMTLAEREGEGYYGDGIYFQAEVKDLDNLIIIPDLDDTMYFEDYFTKKHPKIAMEINKKAKDDGVKFSPFFIAYLINNTKHVDLVFTELMKYTMKGGLKEDYELWHSDDSGVFSKFIKGTIASGLQVATIGSINNKQVIQVTDELGSVYPEKAISSLVTNKDGSFLRGKDGKLVYKDSRVKFSLVEKANAAINPLLSGLNLTQQSVIARDIDKAIMNGKLSELAKNTEMDKLTAKLKKQTDPIKIKEVRKEMSDLFQADIVPFKVPRMSKSTDKAIATFIINKMAEGYNSFDFHIKKNADGPLTKQVLNALDANSEKIKQTAFRNSNLELTMNEIIEENKGIPKTEIFSEETAKNIGKGKKLDWAYLPPGDEDFEGLLYKLASGVGVMGEDQLEFFNENLIIPYSEAMIDLMVARQKMYGDWKDVVTNQHKGIIKLLTTQTDYEGFTYDQAVRVYLWDEAKYKIPGINNRDKFNLTNIVRTNPKLKDFANSVSLLSKQANGYIEPEKNWSYGSILGDMNNIISTVNRAKYLQDWQNRADKIFSKENLTKIEAVYGGEYVRALKNMLARLKSGTNRNPGDSSKLLDWLNNSTANVMFLNTRSSILQLLGSVNFINTSDNNIARAALAFANLPQYWKDVKYLWNSPYLKDRRSGLMNDVAEAEIAQLMDSQKGDDSINKYRRIVNWIRVNGFIGSRVMDAVAIAFGGATFYRNRLNTYKKQNYTEEQAEKKTMADFYQTSEKSQQSADVSKISENQASKTGRALLAFMNTPFQYSRIMKKAAIDIVKGRGNLANNVSKIVFYGFLQNVMFNALQNLVFAIMWSDDDDDEEAKQKDSKQRTLRTLNGVLDGIVRGMGMQYVALSVVKNALMKWYDTTGTPEAAHDVILELLNIFPSVGIKARQVDKAIKAIEYNKELNPEGDKVIPTRAIVESSCSFISVTLHLPADRVYQKVQNILGALDSQNEYWQRIALAFGFSEQNLGIKKEKEQTGSATRGSSLKSPGLSGGGLKSPGLK